MLHQWETGWALEFVLWVQQNQTIYLDGISRILAAVGSNLAYLVLMPLIYWSINRHMARRLLFVLIVAGTIVVAMKAGFARPRPTTLHPDLVRQFYETKSYAFPSGHVAIGAALCIFLALWVRKLWFWGVVAIYVILMSWSRIYSGMHYPHDVVVGLLVGAVSAIGAKYYMPKLSKFWKYRVPTWAEILLVSAVGVGVGLSSQGEITGIAAAGAMIGGGLALAFEEHEVQFITDGTIWQRTLRFILGIILTAGIFVAFLPLTEQYPLLEIVQYGFAIFFALSLYPWVSMKLKLTEHDPQHIEETTDNFDGAMPSPSVA